MTSPSKEITPEFPIKKRGRPVGSKNKVVTATKIRKVAGKEFVFRKKEAAATKSFKRITIDQQKAYESLLDDNIQLMMDNKELVNRINNLEHQASGYRAVVSYLESQVGLRSSQ
jgi:hypothetical protein